MATEYARYSGIDDITFQISREQIFQSVTSVERSRILEDESYSAYQDAVIARIKQQFPYGVTIQFQEGTLNHPAILIRGCRGEDFMHSLRELCIDALVDVQQDPSQWLRTR